MVTVPVSWDSGEDDGLFLAMVDGVPHPIDEEADLLDIAPPGAVVTLNHPGFGAHLLSWEGGIHAKKVRRRHEGQGDSFGP